MKKHTRREVIKYGAKVAGGALFGGAIGGLAGKGVSELKELYGIALTKTGQALADLDSSVKEAENILMGPVKGMQYVEEKRMSFYDRISGRTEEDKRAWREEHGVETKEDLMRKAYESQRTQTLTALERVKQGASAIKKDIASLTAPDKGSTRRGFLRRLLGVAYNNPVSSGTAIGAAAGAGYTGVKGAMSFRRNVKSAKMHDRLDSQEEELKELRGALALLQKDYSAARHLDEELKESRENYSSMMSRLDENARHSLSAKNVRERSGSTRSAYAHRDLENSMKENRARGVYRFFAFILGLSFILFSLYFGLSITGNIVAGEFIRYAPFSGAGLFLCGLGIVWLLLRR